MKVFWAHGSRRLVLGRPSPVRTISTFVRYQSTLKGSAKLSAAEKTNIDKGEEVTTGIITKSPNEALMYFDRMYPRISRFSVVQWFFTQVLGLSMENVSTRLRNQSIPPTLPVALKKVVPREKDGGVFAKYSIDQPEEEPLDVDKIEADIAEYFSNNYVKPWYMPLAKVRVYPVRGSPWIEDLRRAESNMIKVTFVGQDLSQEELYAVLRRYGPINDIVPPKPGDSEPHSAVVSFSWFRDAATARNCVNGMKVKGGKTTIHLSFIPIDHKNIIMEWIVSHPRIVIPIVVALLAALGVIIFEPIRVWFIGYKISGKLVGLERYPWLDYLRRKIKGLFSGVFVSVSDSFTSLWQSHSGAEFSELWKDRIESRDTLRQWVDEGVGTFIVVQGPRGSGKADLVFKHALRGRDNILSLDCDAITHARSESAFVKAVASALGYYPVFPWMNSITKFMDLAVQGLTGQKTGFAESSDTQLKNMLSTAATAIRGVALENKSSKDKMSDEDYLQLHPENKPVVVIRNLVSKSEASKSFVYTRVAEWAASLIEANTAHVLFVTDDVRYDNVLGDALPNQVFKVLSVGDANDESAFSFIQKQIARTNDEKHSALLEGLGEAIKPLGGRMTDLQAFARRIKSGETPPEALNDMIEQARLEVLQMYITKPNNPWSSEQAWTIIKHLAAAQAESDRPTKKKSFFGDSEPDKKEEGDNNEVTIAMDSLVLDPAFATGNFQSALTELEHAEMIALRSQGGRIMEIKAGKPLYQAAFSALVNDRNLKAYMERQIINTRIGTQNSSIKSIENELTTLAAAGAGGILHRTELKARTDYLLKKLYSAQKSIEDLESQLAVQTALITEKK
ncbi:mitochondrial escape protein 2 [Trichomonascus vanleenenianus]|uniref:Yme2p n=1 Tax=Trichomonascus vanleenenianus TaxID=2268995 RepID=UPI003ECB8D80